MFPLQGKGHFVMIEIGTIGINPVVTVKASACKGRQVCLDKPVVQLSVASFAGRDFEAGQSGWMAVSADKRPVAIFLMPGQCISGRLVWEAYRVYNRHGAVWSKVVRMALLAWVNAEFMEGAMQPLPGLHLGRNICVALHASIR